jgi:hypothetical protein
VNLEGRLERLETRQDDENKHPWLIADLESDGPAPTEAELDELIAVIQRVRPGCRIVEWDGSLESSRRTIEEPVQIDSRRRSR